MRRNYLLIIMIILVLFFAIGNSKESDTKEPVMITSAGQSADILMVKILATKAGISYDINKLAKVEDLTDCKSLIIVTGASTKGLGAAGIDKNDELERINLLIAKAKENKIKIITMHLGGKARRGKLSDEFNKLSAENADYLIVRKSGDEDKFFSKIAENNEIEISLIEKIIDTKLELEKIYNKEKK